MSTIKKTVQADKIFETERYLVLLEKKHLKQNAMKEKTWGESWENYSC